MKNTDLLQKASAYLDTLCLTIGERCVGSANNRRATDFFAHTVSALGFQTQCPVFDCMDWSQDGARLAAGSERFEVFVAPYTLGCDVDALLCMASTVEELRSVA